MAIIKEKLAAVDGEAIAESMNQKGYALVSNLLTKEDCKELVKGYFIDALP